MGKGMVSIRWMKRSKSREGLECVPDWEIHD